MAMAMAMMYPETFNGAGGRGKKNPLLSEILQCLVHRCSE
jgi:hypothetical protein